jgi:hypothetical protein
MVDRQLRYAAAAGKLQLQFCMRLAPPRLKLDPQN